MPADLKAQFGDASILRRGRVVFNIGGNKYRLVVKINYAYRVVYVRFVGTIVALRSRTSDVEVMVVLNWIAELKAKLAKK